MLWEEHIAWTRMFIISMAEGLADLDLVTGRLLRNPADMAAAFRVFYGDGVAAEFKSLLTDHLTIAAQLVKAAKAGDAAAAEEAEERWYANADAIVAFLNRINPNWPQETMRRMWHEHLRLTKAEAVARLNKDYAADIALYDEIEKQALCMADSLTEGIVEQFPEVFPAGR
ncbi:MAG: acetylglutamate kinase [Firmicutes bacterium]|nr:acetylglutamate kinase [Bacillota bacterium]